MTDLPAAQNAVSVGKTQNCPSQRTAQQQMRTCEASLGGQRLSWEAAEELQMHCRHRRCHVCRAGVAGGHRHARDPWRTIKQPWVSISNYRLFPCGVSEAAMLAGCRA